MGATSEGSNSGNFGPREVLESGVYPARCIQVVELGTHENIYQGVASKRKELFLVWETNEAMSDGRPFVISHRLTNSLNEKSKLYGLLTKWRAKAFTDEEKRKFHLNAILDKPCLLSVTVETSKKGSQYNKLSSIMPLPKDMQLNERVNELVDFGIADINTSEFDKLYPFVQDIINSSEEGKLFNTIKRENEEEMQQKPFSKEEDLPF